jgi:hypothetical protein
MPTIKAKPSKSPRAAPAPTLQPPTDLSPKGMTAPENRCEFLKGLGERVEGHIRFMCKLEGMVGVSKEAKERALAIFHQRLAGFETELGKIREGLELE